MFDYGGYIMDNNCKKIILFLLAMGISLNLFAQEGNSPDIKHFSLGSALSFLPDGGGSGAFFAIKFALQKKFRDIP
jgi:hypothetical protein